VHIDEAGHRYKGQRGWAWIVTSKQTSVLKLSHSRGKKVLQELVGKYGGCVISDGYGGYNYFKSENRQICWSNLLRDFERFAHSCHTDLSIKGRRLVLIAREVFALVKGLAKGLIGKCLFRRRIGKNKKELFYVLKSILKLPGLE
jgi:transposase